MTNKEVKGMTNEEVKEATQRAYTMMAPLVPVVQDNMTALAVLQEVEEWLINSFDNSPIPELTKAVLQLGYHIGAIHGKSVAA